jgi:hypothetical protein
MVGWSCFLSEKHFAKPLGLSNVFGFDGIRKSQ